MTASSAVSVGKVSLRYTSETKGFITLPGEGEKEATRFNFGYPTVPNTLLGLWTFTSLGASIQGLSADAVSLVSIDSKTLMAMAWLSLLTVCLVANTKLAA